MPEYTFRNKTTGDVFDAEMKIAERAIFLEENPEYEQVLHKLNLGDAYRMGVTKVDDDFSNLINRVKKNNHGSTIP